MLKDFIKEYINTYQISPDSGFLGEFKRFYQLMREPKFYPSSELVDRLNLVSSLNYEPLLVAIVGQFSSGKSSFLNAILEDDILPTGVVPVTAKPTYIKYAPNKMLKALFNDGREAYYDVSEIGAFVDQRFGLKDVKSLTIYAPNKLLKKVSFVDTPGLNSRSDADTLETKKVLKEASGLIWISLIDNAARNSELNELSLVPNSLKQNAICLLNQKDKISDDEISNVLQHAKITYKEYFSDVLAISSKMQKEKQSNSGFEPVFAFLENLDEKKQGFIQSQCKQILLSCISQNEKFIEILDELNDIFNSFSLNSAIKLNNLRDTYSANFCLLFEEIKQNAKLIADEINSNLVAEKKYYFKPKNSILSRGKFERIEYERINIKIDKILSKLVFNDDKIKNIFKNFNIKINKFEDNIKSDLSSIFEDLKDEVLRYKAKYESLRRSDEMHSNVFFADIRKFCSEVYSLFLNDFEKNLFSKFATLGLFFEKINIKIATNYENSIKLSVYFISQKCQKASDDYEKDPLTFALYYPKLEEIGERVLNNLNYYEFENDFIGTKAFILRFIDSINKDFDVIKQSNLHYIQELKSIYSSYISQLQSTNFIQLD